MSVAISVIIPCYNGARHLRDAIASALNQTFPPREVIVVDDGSSDDSAAIAASFGPPVRLIRQENRGEAGARNTGAAAATGSHFFFLDADDLIRPDALERLGAAAAQNPDAMILMRSVPFADDPAKPTGEPSQPPEQFFPRLIRTCIGVPHTWLTPASVYRRTVGFAPTRNYFVDWEFWCKAALLEPQLCVLPYVGALYRRHDQSMSANTPTPGRVRGHVAVMVTLATGMLSRPHLLDHFGDDLFWGSWVAIDRARKAGVAWPELQELTDAVTRITRQRPSSLRASSTIRAVRWLGFRLAYRLNQAVDTIRPRSARRVVGESTECPTPV